MTPGDENALEVVADLVRRLNQTWLDGRIDELRPFFDAEVVLVAPGFVQRLTGRDELINSYRAFVDNATIHHFEMQEPVIEVFGGTAIATCPYEMEYSLAGRRWKGNGHDVLVLLEADGEWRVVWRHLAAGPETEIV
jgi:hypothetical protein